MRLREVFRYELEYRLRRPLTWVYVAMQTLLTLWAMFATFEGGTELFNAPVRLAGGAAIATMAGILISAALFADAALRDVEAGMDPLLFTSRVRKAEYLGGRFLAALAVNAIVVTGIPAAQLIGGLLAAPEHVGPFRAGALVQPFLLFVLPNVVLFGAILFTIAALARRAIPVYLGAIGIFIAYLVVANNLEPVKSLVLFAFIDPLGVGLLERIVRYWTPAESNSRLIGFPAMLLLNRAVWLGVAAAVLVGLHRAFRFAHHDGGGRRRSGLVAEEATPSRPPLAVPQVAGTFGRRTRVRQTLDVARRSIEEIALTRTGLATLLVAVGLSLLFGWNVGETMFDTSTWPVTWLVAEEVMSRRIGPVIALLIAIFAGELVWKDRAAGTSEIVDAMPVSSGALVVGRFLALVAMLVVVHVAFMVTGIVLQIVQGYRGIEPAIYGKILLGTTLVDWTLIAALAMTVHVLVNQKYLAHIVVVLAFAFTKVSAMAGIHHHLLIYGTDPERIYSDMNGFGPFLAPFVWFKLYWAAWALLLGVAATVFWVRGRETGLRRLRGATFPAPVARTTAIAIVLILVFGGFVFYNTNVLNEYRSPDDAGRPQAEYEKRYKRFENVPQPTIARVQLRAEIHSDTPAVHLRGTYHLVNRTGAAIDSVHVLLLDPAVEARSIAFDRAAKSVLVDDENRYRVYALERALRPGDALQLAFDLTFRPRGFRADSQPKEVVRNGTAFNRRWLPAIGYQPIRELSDAEERERFGLPVRRRTAVRQSRWILRNEDLVDIDTVIGTDADQIAITSGVLRRSWTENGRRYFHYHSEPPAMFGADVFSAKWAVREDRWNGVALQVLHHPGHDGGNVDRTLRSMKASLDYFTEQFGPYPYSHLRLVEVPRYGGFGRAMANVISFTEEYFVSRVKEGEIDLPFYGTAHEVAHTWWGGMLRGANMPGQGFLSESLANYSAMMLMEKTYGAAVARRVYQYQMERYLTGRAEQSREVPLLDVEDQPYIAYRKGAIAMYTLREHIGDEAVNRALRRFADRYRNAGPPFPTSRDLYAELRAETPQALHAMLADWFETVTIWEVRVERAVVERTAAGEYVVTLDVVGKKGRADRLGAITEVPMNDLVEIGVFARGEGETLGEPLHLKRHTIRSGKQTLRITVAREPARAGIDPYRMLIDREPGDNVFDVRPARE